ncbi:MAG: AMP-binding protein [Gammaproteobacteria bacterium]|nr:AMP-binding protein [Gammaproteobacteria bacterium]
MEKKNTVAPEATKTLDALFFDRVRRMSASVAYKEYDKKRREWRGVSWAGLGLEMTRWRGALEREEFKPGSRVAIMLESSKEWVVFEQAAMVLDLIVVPIFPNETPENVAYIIRDSGCEAILIQDIHAWDRLGSIQNVIDTIRLVILLTVREEQEEEVRELADKRLVIAKDWLPVEGGPLHERSADTNAICTIVYTTGSTGLPKGVMLSHLNILTNARAMLNMLAIRHSDLILSHLNFAHIVDRTCSYYMPMIAGAITAFARHHENFDRDLVELDPSILITESHFLTRLSRKVDQELEEHVFLDRMLFKLAVKAGWANFEQEQKRITFHPLAFLWPMLKGMSSHAILPKIIGKRLRRVITSGTAMSPQMSKLFLGLGVNVLQGYHITEAGGIISLNTVMENFAESVGLSLPTYKIKINEDGQMLLSSDNGLSQGYMGQASDEDDSTFVLDRLNTGDMAEYHDKHLFLHGRMSEQLKINNRYYNPELLEAAIIGDSLFDFAYVSAEGDALCTLVVLNRSLWNSLTGDAGLDPKDANNYSHPKSFGLLISRLNTAVRNLPYPPEIKAFIVSDTAWSVENGLLTPTLRPKRDAIHKRFAVQLASAYAQAHSDSISAIREELSGSSGRNVSDEDIPTL